MAQIDHPDYYNQLDVECIDVVEHFNFNIGSALKYLWRGGLKQEADVLDDYAKAIWYINREIMRIKKAQAETKLEAYNNFN